MIDDVKVAGTKVGIGLGLGTLTAITLNEWVAITTIVYIVLQTAHLIWKWLKEAKNGK